MAEIKAHHRTDFEADRWPETEYFFGLTSLRENNLNEKKNTLFLRSEKQLIRWIVFLLSGFVTRLAV